MVSESKPAPTRSFAKIVGLVVSIAAGVAFGFTAGGLAAKQGPIAVVSFLACAWLALALHEFGHYLGGRSVGFQCHLFTVGPVRVELKDSGKYQVCFNRDFVTWGGLCGMMPTTTDGTAHRFATTVAAGPVMSLLVGVAAVAASYLPGISAFVHLTLLNLGGISLMLLLVTAIPLSNGAFLSDGARWLQLRQAGPRGDRDRALLHLMALLSSGQPAKAWPDELIDDTLRLNDQSIFEATGHFFAYAKHLLANQRDEARSHAIAAAEIMATQKGALSHPFELERAFVEAIFDHNTTRAKEILDDPKRKAIGVHRNQLHRLKIAMMIATGQLESAKNLIETELAVPLLDARQRVERDILTWLLDQLNRETSVVS